MGQAFSVERLTKDTEIINNYSIVKEDILDDKELEEIASEELFIKY